MMKLACADFTFPKLTNAASLQLLGMLGCTGVDIGLFEGRSHLYPSREFKQLNKNARALQRLAGDQGLKIADIFLQMAPDFRRFAITHPSAARRKKARDWFLRTLDYAAACACRHVTTLPGVAWEDE